jgi:O-Antigen ligase
MIRDTIFALGLLLSTASQLRPGSSPVGLGEVLLLAWSLWVLADKLSTRGANLNSGLARLVGFWGIFAAVECLGLLNGLARGAQYDPQWLLHDVLAYPLVGAVACAAAAESAERLRRVSWLVILLGAISLALQSAAAGGLFHVPSMMPWYWDRLRGWSANPNQLAFLCTALVLLAVHLTGTAARFGSAAAAIACALLSLVVGRLTGSDTFTLMLVVASTLLLLLKLRFRMLQSGPHLEARVAVGLVLAVGLPLLAVSVAPLVMAARSANGDLGAGVLKNGGKDAAAEADLRLALWQQAVQRGVDSGMLGLGPGPHLAIPATLVAARVSEAGQPGNIQHPQQNGAPNFEAHNTVLDLFVQGGLAADLALLWLLGSAFRTAYRGQSAGLATLLCGITLFGMTNLIIRQPLFWFSIALCLNEPPIPKRITNLRGYIMPRGNAPICSASRDAFSPGTPASAGGYQFLQFGSATDHG